ncbi:hypothetical protein RF11_11838 [Thelohanellus kitauei]|uniref:Uncharacterized protein n=1 Tax=Thelohanellus kitauei TaxID=669202 RepID=A0A0C2MSE2_THEKT|nr:hypothetical protein RF11_11838 [Thelohanellus kitauei]
MVLATLDQCDSKIKTNPNLCKNEYQGGHPVNGSWDFGGIERTNEQHVFLVEVPDRTVVTLISIITVQRVAWIAKYYRLFSQLFSSTNDLLPRYRKPFSAFIGSLDSSSCQYYQGNLERSKDENSAKK